MNVLIIPYDLLTVPQAVHKEIHTAIKNHKKVAEDENLITYRILLGILEISPKESIVIGGHMVEQITKPKLSQVVSISWTIY